MFVRGIPAPDARSADMLSAYGVVRCKEELAGYNAMGEEPKVARYAVYNRVELAIGFAVLAFLLFSGAYLTWGLPRNVGNGGVLLLVPLVFLSVLPLLASVGAAVYLRAIWFLAYQYAYTDSWVEARDPVLRHRVRISFGDVLRIKSAYIPVGHAWQRSIRRVHTLESLDGRHIRMSEGLACWPEIKSRCCSAEYERLNSKFFGVKE